MIKCSKAQAAIMLAPRGRSAELAMTTYNVDDVINQGKTTIYSESNKIIKAPEPAS
jgi:preprotein translocase subunit SecA